jgi:hypothetical protein
MCRSKSKKKRTAMQIKQAHKARKKRVKNKNA